MVKTQLHPRNQHRGSYDYSLLTRSCPHLAPFIAINTYGNESIDFTNPKAVKTLNQALLKHFYNITWDLPASFLCPPIPSRADYIHSIADLLSESNESIAPQGKKITILDIGVGANCIYPLIGHREYGWNFIGTDIDTAAISHANSLLARNGLSGAIEIRQQKSSSQIFEGILKETDSTYAVSMCNPPFHASFKEAKAAAQKKWKNLGIKTKTLNFGGQNNELWCPGGEVAFIERMIEESVDVPCGWFTTLVSKASSLPRIYRALSKLKGVQVKTVDRGQGQKRSRIVAWKFSHRASL